MKLRKLVALCLLCAISLNLAGCASPFASLFSRVRKAPAPEDTLEKALDFAVRLFQNCARDGENTLVSPLSVYAALSLTAGGAKGETLAEMEKALGMKADELKAYFKSFLESLPGEEDGVRFHLANSVWIADSSGFVLDPDFAAAADESFGAEIRSAPFNDETLKEINDWASENTDGMVPEILDKIFENAVMYLINALAFDGKWLKPYGDFQVREGEFTRSDKTKKTVEFMHSTEHYYLNSRDAVGFIKFYEGERYAFAALLPKKGSVSDYVSSLSWKKLSDLFDEAETVKVNASLPKFEVRYGQELSGVLSGMGMPSAFEPSADFSGLSSSPVSQFFISRVMHKSFISVTEEGTKAGAATSVEMVSTGAIRQEKPKEVILDRPFVYMLVDIETYFPFFIGTMEDPG